MEQRRYRIQIFNYFSANKNIISMEELSKLFF